MSKQAQFFRQLFRHFQNQVSGLCSTHLTCDMYLYTCIGTTVQYYRVQCCPDYYYSYLYTTTLCQYCTSTTVRTSVRRTCTRLVYVRQSYMYSCSTCSVRTGTPDYHWIYRNSHLYTLSVPKSVPCSYPTRYTVTLRGS